jgi:hypothetical protein
MLLHKKGIVVLAAGGVFDAVNTDFMMVLGGRAS